MKKIKWELSTNMLQLLKQAIRRVVPPSVLAFAMVTRERQRLSRIPRGRFDAKRLRSLSRAEMETAFTDETVGKAWCRDLDLVNRVMPYEDIYGGVCPGERRAIYQLIAWLKPQQVLEIGTHIGASTLVIAQALRSHAGPGSQLLTGDILDVNNPEQGAFKNLGTLSPRDALHQLGLQDRVRFEAKPALQLMKSLDQRFDFVFLDGDHSAASVYKEVCAALDLLAPHGLILLHDFYPEGKKIYPNGMVVPGPFLASQRIHSELPTLNFMAIGELPWETKQGVRKTSLALVSRR
jgi:predicted O-methyltransferase YrrM